MSTEDVGLSIHSNDGEYNSDNEAVLEDKMEAIQALATQVESEETMSVESAVDDQSSRRKTRQSLNGAVNRHRSNGANIPNTRAKTIQKSEAVPKSHGAPVAFGRVLGPLFGRPSRLSAESEPGSAFLILDHAERLFTLSATQKAEPNNFLAQLLLLPQVMKLNLTVIIISRSTLLDCSRECPRQAILICPSHCKILTLFILPNYKQASTTRPPYKKRLESSRMVFVLFMFTSRPIEDRKYSKR